MDVETRDQEDLWGFRPLTIEDQIKRFFQDLNVYCPDLKSSNPEIADLIKRYPDKFIGFGFMNPNKDENYVDAKLQEISDLGLKDVKMLPTLQMFNPTENKKFDNVYFDQPRFPVSFSQRKI